MRAPDSGDPSELIKTWPARSKKIPDGMSTFFSLSSSVEGDQAKLVMKNQKGRACYSIRLPFSALSPRPLKNATFSC